MLTQRRPLPLNGEVSSENISPPDSRGTVSGTIGGSGKQTNSSYVSDRMTTNGSPTEPITTPPLPSPLSLETVPMQSAQLVRIDNTGNSSASTFDIQAGTYVSPAANKGATIPIMH
jgi:hypothetical protein